MKTGDNVEIVQMQLFDNSLFGQVGTLEQDINPKENYCSVQIRGQSFRCHKADLKKASSTSANF